MNNEILNTIEYLVYCLSCCVDEKDKQTIRETILKLIEKVKGDK